MKRIFLLSAFVLLASLSFSQNSDDTIVEMPYMKNTVYFEALGNGITYSLNYDRILAKHGKFALAGRIGGTYNSATNGFVPEFAFPLEISVLYGRRNHQMEFGAGYTAVHLEEDSNDYLGYYDEDNRPIRFRTLRFGYRYQNSKGGPFFRVGVMLLVMDRPNLYHSYWPWGGVSLGYTIKTK